MPTPTPHLITTKLLKSLKRIRTNVRKHPAHRLVNLGLTFVVPFFVFFLQFEHLIVAVDHGVPLLSVLTARIRLTFVYFYISLYLFVTLVQVFGVSKREEWTNLGVKKFSHKFCLNSAAVLLLLVSFLLHSVLPTDFALLVVQSTQEIALGAPIVVENESPAPAPNPVDTLTVEEPKASPVSDTTSSAPSRYEREYIQPDYLEEKNDDSSYDSGPSEPARVDVSEPEPSRILSPNFDSKIEPSRPVYVPSVAAAPVAESVAAPARVGVSEPEPSRILSPNFDSWIEPSRPAPVSSVVAVSVPEPVAAAPVSVPVAEPVAVSVPEPVAAAPVAERVAAVPFQSAYMNPAPAQPVVEPDTRASVLIFGIPRPNPEGNQVIVHISVRRP